MLRRSISFSFLIALISTAAPSSSTAAEPPVDFNREVLPILTDNCFACHGPDEAERKAQLRLDLHESVVGANRYGEHPVLPGDPEASLVIERVTAEDPKDIMPPPATGKTLSAEQVATLTRWVLEGARWEEHWAFTKPERPEAPEVKKRKWPRNEIDRFVLNRLEQEGLKPSREADKPTLIRRASLDLTGLPPTPREVDAYLADRSPESYEKLLDRLLDSPAYGEQMARHWMDAARYADSHGYHIDSERSMWKWRDWVIDAFNRNVPFDQFTVEQLAGDLLPEPTLDQKIATGYVRANMSTGEGGAIEDEYQAKYAFDRLETTSTIWMGLTMTCARCHTHKYDPITHNEYFQLFAFFNNLDEPVMDGNKPNPDPFIKLPTPEQSERQSWLSQAITDAEPKLDLPDPALDIAQANWETRWRGDLEAALDILMPSAAQSPNNTPLRVLDDRSIAADAPMPPKDVHEITVKAIAGRLTALRLEVLPRDSTCQSKGPFRLSGFEAELTLPPTENAEKLEPKKLKFNRAWANSRDGEHEPGRAIDGNADTGWSPDASLPNERHGIVVALAEPLEVPDASELLVRLRYEATTNGHSGNRYRLALLPDHNQALGLIPQNPQPWHVLGPFPSPGVEAGLAQTYDPENEIDLERTYPGAREEIKWEKKPEIENGKPHLLVNELHGVHGVYYLHRELTLPEARTLDLHVRADDVFKLWVNGEPMAARTAKERLGEGPLKISVNLRAGINTFLVKVVNLQGACHFTFRLDNDTPDQLAPDIAGRFLAGGPLTGTDATSVRHFFRRISSPDWKVMADQLALWREENDLIEKAIVTTMVAKERQKPRDTFMLIRGEYDQPGDKVSPGVPSILPPLPDKAPANRLGLAQWLVHPDHPLVARVTVNRLWQQLFGTGLVKTAEDFGVQGERPSHPELLDWLATELIQSGWDVKHLQRLIMTSATYRQSSQTRPELFEQDPENRLLARGPRFRVDAEVVRDSALAIGGLLVENVGGRSVKPFEPPGLWEAVSFNNSQKYVQDIGDNNYRRSLYTFWKRQSPPSNMLLFDAPTREYCVVRRPRTNTPLQALALLNDPQFVEASRAFAQRILLEGGDTPESRITFAFRLATARKPDKAEVRLLTGLLHEQLEEFRQNADATESFLAVGAFQASPDLDPAELAAWSTIANLILNLDETLTKS